MPSYLSRFLLPACLLCAAPAAVEPPGRAGATPPGAVRLRHGGFVSAVAFTPDGKTLISAGGDGSIRLRDATTGTEARRLGGHKGGVYSLALARDGRTLASGGADRAVRLWDVKAGKEVRQVGGFRTDVVAVALSADGRQLAAATGGGGVEYLAVRAGPVAH
jgi:WD40 repeat protein